MALGNVAGPMGASPDVTYTGTILTEPTSARGTILKRLRAIRAQASFLRPVFWSSYVIERDLRLPLIGGERTDNVELTFLESPQHELFNDLLSITKCVGVGKMKCMQFMTNGAVAVLARVSRDSTMHAAGCGWITQSDTVVPFLNARFVGDPSVCMLMHDFVKPEFRGLGLQRMLGRHRLAYAMERGAKRAFGYIRRANTPSLRNAIEFRPVALVHNVRCGNWRAAHVRTLGHRKCDELPFLNWPSRQAFFITPRSNRRLV